MTISILTINHRSHQRILPRRLRGKTKNEHPAAPLRKSTSNRQSALSTTFGNPVPINAINNKNDEERKTLQFEIDSPPDKQNTDNYPSLKSLIQEMGFTEKASQYRASTKLIEAISPKPKTGHREVVDLTSPPEDDTTADNNNKVLFVNTKLHQEGETKTTKTGNILQEEEEHENQGEKITKVHKQAEN